MNKEERYELIEGYLDGTLSDKERQAFESRLAMDPDFRHEVELHRAFHTSLGNKEKHHLRAALGRLLLNPPVVDTPLPENTNPPPSSGSNWFQVFIIIALMMLTGLILWYWLANSDKKPVFQPNHSQQQDTTTIAPTKQLDTVTVPAKNNRNKEIAQADPKDFVPNPVLDIKVGDILRGSGIIYEPTSPILGNTLPLQNGLVLLPVKGIISGGEVPKDQPLDLLIYSNRPEDWTQDKPIKTISMPLIPLEDGSYRVDFQAKLRVRQGLYYLVVGQKLLPNEGNEYNPIWIDKFVVRA